MKGFFFCIVIDFFFYWFKGSKIEFYFMIVKMFESDIELILVISNLVWMKRIVLIV